LSGYNAITKIHLKIYKPRYRNNMAYLGYRDAVEYQDVVEYLKVARSPVSAVNPYLSFHDF